MRIGLLFLSLALTAAARAQPVPSPAGLPAAETPPDETGSLPPAAPPPSASHPSPAAGPPPVDRGPGPVPPPFHRSPPTPQAAAGAPAEEEENHDGFYLRLQLGGGYASMSSSLNGADRSIKGTGTAFDVALGGAINPHVIIYGTFISATALSPASKLSGQPPPAGSGNGMIAGTVDVGGFGSAGVVGVGGGAASYFASNVFLAGSLLGSRLSRNDNNGNTVARSNWGFTFEGLLGKEWWVSDNWGLGLCGRVLLGAMKDHPLASENVSTWKLAVFSALFSASYN